jgi:hypothetical protein
MATTLITEKYQDVIHDVLHCYDRVVISGNLQPLCYAKGMTKYLYTHQIRIFDYTQFAEPLRNLIRENAQSIAEENGLEIEFISKKDNFRKEERVKELIEQRGKQPGLVHIFSAMEQCQAYRPWHNKQSHKTYVKMTQGKCLHYYYEYQLGVPFVYSFTSMVTMPWQLNCKANRSFLNKSITPFCALLTLPGPTN